MIKKIDINNFGSYSGYSWNRVLSQDRSFKDVNIICEGSQNELLDSCDEYKRLYDLSK